MKTKMKALVAAVALCAAGGANAAIDLGGTGLGDNTELFLSAWDPVNQVSYTRDLGIHFEDFLATNQNSAASWLGGDNAVWATQFGASNVSNIRWNVAAVNNFNSGGTNLSTYGYMTTSNDSPTVMKSSTDANLSSIDNAIGYGAGYIQYVNTNSNTALNDTTGYGVADGGAYAGALSWNNNFGGVVGYANDAGVGQSMAFYDVGYDSSFTSSVVTALAGMFSLAADGTLTYSVSGGATPTPVPPALWLLGSALVGLVGVSRRKREAADEGLMA